MKNVSSISVKSLCLIFLFALFNLQGQETNSGNSTAETFTISGSVFEQESAPLGGVNVVLKGTKEGVVTDYNGNFEFPRKLEVDDVLIFSYIGYNPQEYKVVANSSDNMAIKIVFDLSDISLMGAVEVEGVYSSKRNIFQKIAGLFK